MTSPRDGLDAGRCPSPGSAAAPAAVFNPPGLAALAYRIGVRTDFLARMLALLATATLPDGAAEYVIFTSRDDGFTSRANLDRYRALVRPPPLAAIVEPDTTSTVYKLPPAP